MSLSIKNNLKYNNSLWSTADFYKAIITQWLWLQNVNCTTDLEIPAKSEWSCGATGRRESPSEICWAISLKRSTRTTPTYTICSVQRADGRTFKSEDEEKQRGNTFWKDSQMHFWNHLNVSISLIIWEQTINTGAKASHWNNKDMSVFDVHVT